MKIQKIIIDTDPGHDDAMALMLACKSPELDVLAVTTVAGNSIIENTTRNARYILRQIGLRDLPVCSGANRPLKRNLVQAVVHGKSGLEGIDPSNSSKLTNDAPEQILRILKEYPNEITILTLGPLTNIAQAIIDNPETMKLAKRIVSMGGAIGVAGNKNRVAEFNIFVDPEAADIVLNFPVPVTLVPLDACNHVQMTLTDFKRVNNNAIRTLLMGMVRPYIANLKKDAGVEAALMYDPLAVFYLLQPKSCTTKTFNIQIECMSELTRGMTVADRRSITDGLESNTTVVMDIEADAFVERFIKTLNN